MSLVFPYLPAGQGGGGVSVVTWADGTDAEIAAMVDAADAGQIVLSDYWSIGDERTVHLSAMTAGNVLKSQSEQDVVLVLMDTGTASGYKDVDDKTVNFVVGQKDCLTEKAKMNTAGGNAGSWKGCAMRTDLNNEYCYALPSEFRACLKPFKTITAQLYNGSTNQTSIDYIALFAEKEVFGSKTYSNSTEAAALTQIEYYKTTVNRIKQINRSNVYSNVYWYERSPSAISSDYFCAVSSSGTESYDSTNEYGVSPFMCI